MKEAFRVAFQSDVIILSFDDIKILMGDGTKKGTDEKQMSVDNGSNR